MNALAAQQHSSSRTTDPAAPAMQELALGPRDLDHALIDPASPYRTRRLGRILVATDVVSQEAMENVLRLQDHAGGSIGTLLMEQGHLAEDALATALALQHGVLRVRPISGRISLDLVDRIGTAFCVEHHTIPWRRIAGLTVFATSRPHKFHHVRPMLEDAFGGVRMVVADERDMASILSEFRIDIAHAHAAKDAPTRRPQAATQQDRPSRAGLPDHGSSFEARPIGEILIRTGALVPANLDRALRLQSRGGNSRLGAIMVGQRYISEDALASGLALQSGVLHVRPLPERIDQGLMDQLGADFCLRNGLMPWRRAGHVTVVATSRPQRFEDIRPQLEATLGPVRMAIASKADLTCAILELRSEWLTARAEARPPSEMSVRRWHPAWIAAFGLAPFIAVGGAVAVVPSVTITLLMLWSVTVLLCAMLLRTAALIAHVTAPRPAEVDFPAPSVTPSISLLVPLLSEANISAHLVDRLSDLDYPGGKLEICLVCEADDIQTETALEQRGLPSEFRVIVVPTGTVRTKPRALNYALDFCSGDIIGIYDAEDAPEPDQLRRVAARFAAAPQDVVCLQGRLAFYNAAQNWLSRCFAVDYGGWFGVVLPGLARLGFAIPLGGTGLFFRRNALEAAGRWDAHNVTEDADLGVRIARMGWRAEILDTTTREEANCHLGAWIRQRARWIKGYALTWAVHMANPRELWRDLGPKRFIGIQILFFGSLSAFVLAPVLWSFWLLPLGYAHPADKWPRILLTSIIVLFIVSELINITIGALGALRNGERWLVKWVPTTIAYFPLATLATYRAIIDLIRRPFFWDKTAHGLSLDCPKGAPRSASQHSEEDDFQTHSKYAP